LYQSTCLSVCPNTYYAFNGQCLLCASPCANCNNTAAQCLTCITNYFLDIASSNPTRCVLTCTNTNYVGISGTCQQCTSNCLTCSKVQSNCTSCDNTNYQLFSNACIRNCPLGMYSNAVGSCVNCVSPCKTCSSSISCNTCVSNYYLYNNSVCTTTCPNGYI
jgi:proprotein convertase subtilisin/kexin type 5